MAKAWFHKGYRCFAINYRGQILVWSEEYNGWIDPEEHPGLGEVRWRPMIWRDKHFSEWYKRTGYKIARRLRQGVSTGELKRGEASLT